MKHIKPFIVFEAVNRGVRIPLIKDKILEILSTLIDDYGLFNKIRLYGAYDINFFLTFESGVLFDDNILMELKRVNNKAKVLGEYVYNIIINLYKESLDENGNRKRDYITVDMNNIDISLLNNSMMYSIQFIDIKN